MKKVVKDYTLCDTTYIAEYSDYVEHCEINDIEPQDENSSDYWEYVSEMQQLEWEDFLENIKYSDVANEPVLLTGCLGLWNGCPTIQPIRFENIRDAVEKCASGVNDIKVTVENGIICVYGYHHDGTNRFEIHKLSKKGIKVSDNWYDEYSPSGDTKDYMLCKYHDYIY